VLGSPLQEVYNCKGIVSVLPKRALYISVSKKNFAGKNDEKRRTVDIRRKESISLSAYRYDTIITSTSTMSFKDIIMDELWYTLVVLYMGTMGFAIGFFIGMIL